MYKRQLEEQLEEKERQLQVLESRIQSKEKEFVKARTHHAEETDHLRLRLATATAEGLKFWLG